MHRAGTSLIARAVNLLGVYLGPKEHLMKPRKDNPTGFWEHKLLTDLNDAILSRFGGTWDRPPAFPKGWEKSPKVADLRRRARRIILEDFHAAGFWGWKDPRTCLTLPFWQRLFPRMRYVICLRNPVDVAKSLERRDGFPLEKSASLWINYMTSALEHTAGQPRVLMFYEDFVSNWQRELPHLSEFIGRARQAEQPKVKEAIRRFVREDLQHHRTDVASVIREPDIPFRSKALFAVLRAYVSIKEDRIDEQSRGYKELQDTLDAFTHEVGLERKDDADYLREALSKSEEEKRALADQISSTLNSTSWRITAPLRRIRSFLRVPRS